MIAQFLDFVTVIFPLLHLLAILSVLEYLKDLSYALIQKKLEILRTFVGAAGLALSFKNMLMEWSQWHILLAVALSFGCCPMSLSFMGIFVNALVKSFSKSFVEHILIFHTGVFSIRFL